MHITDLQTYNNFPLFLRAIIATPSASNDAQGFEQHTNLIQTILALVDNVAALKLSSTVQSKCEKARKLLKNAANEKKQAEEQEKKAEARREQERVEREKLKKMAPEEQAKYEEK